MINSMTGFGRGSRVGNGRNFVIEIKSVNHRYLDLNIKMPRSFSSLEDRIRELVSSKINRGKVDVYISQKIYERSDVEAVLNESLAESYLSCLRKIKENYDIRDDISVSTIARFPEVITVQQKEEDLEEIWDVIQDSLIEALNNLLDMRKKEGLKLYEDILKKCDNIKLLTDKIEEKSPLVVDEYKNRLHERVKALMDDSDIDEGRIAMEVAIFADKASIDEEIVRLNSHMVQMKENLKSDEPVGRKLDFIVQEMNRETNTIASKANDLEIVNATLNIKSEIEKIREQTQNIE